MATTYYAVDLPTVGGDAETWGGENNDAHDAWDAALASPANTLKGNNTGATAAHLNLTPAQAAAMLPAMVGDSGSGGTKGLAPAPATGDARAVLTGAGTYDLKIAAAAHGYVALTSTTAVLAAGSSGITSVTYASVDGSLASATVVFSTAMPNTIYRIHLGFESNTAGSEGAGGVTNKTVNGFVINYYKAISTGVGISVFKG
jgi:hypothetical protein